MQNEGKEPPLRAEQPKVPVVRVAGWERFRWLRHGFSTRGGGVSEVYGPGELNLGFTADDEPEKVRENRRRLVEAVGGDPAALVTVRQVHGTTLLRVRAGQADLRADDGRALREADALVTSDPGVVLGIQVADCVPVLVADTRLRVVAAFHAGWRGTAAAIVEAGVGQMAAEFGCRAEDLTGAVGPAIGSCCYAVGEEVREQFTSAFPYAEDLFERRGDGLYANLAEANRRQMIAAGLHPARVFVVGECTACAKTDGRRKFFSHRAEKGFTGRAMGMIGIAHDERDANHPHG